ncbi:MAG TPA: HAD family phosphatase [Terriglobia bacterium]|nr:HAD family phosphatase [Terriglobia bacterium]
MLRALIFDFDGVLVDSEPLIFKLTRQMALQEGWTLSHEQYFRDYLALDDRGIIEHLYETHGRPLDLARRDELIQWKFHAYAEAIRDGLPAVPGAVEFVTNVAGQYPLAIASGSLRSEVEHLLVKIGLRDRFLLLVTAEDTDRCKPDPQIFVKAVAGLNRLPIFREQPLLASQCLAIEDAPAGVRAAQGAGMKCLAISHSRPPAELGHADFTVREFSEVHLDKIQAAFD